MIVIRKADFSAALSWILGSILLLVLLVSEDRISIFGISLSNIWKLSFLALCFLVMVTYLNRPVATWNFFALLLVLTYPLGVATGLSRVSLETMAVLITLPLVPYIFRLRGLVTSETAHSVTLGLAFFVIFTSILFITGILSPAIITEGSMTNLMSRYGGDATIMVSFFKHPSIAGKIFALSTAIVTFFWVNKRGASVIVELVYISAIVLGLYCTYLTFVRTAWVMLVIMLSIGVFSSFREIGLKHGICLALFLAIISFLLMTEPAFVNRVLGVKLGSAQDLDAVAYSSGRLLIWWNIYEAMRTAGLGAWVFGLGASGYENAVGMVYAHSMIVQIFAFSGILGVLLLAAFFIALIRYVVKAQVNFRYKRFVLSVVLAYGFAALVSHGIEFWGAVLLAGLLVELECQHRRSTAKYSLPRAGHVLTT